MEILLGMRNYSQAIDMWGVGCIIAELFIGKAILPGTKHGSEDERDHELAQFLEIAKVWLIQYTRGYSQDTHNISSAILTSLALWLSWS